MTVAEFAAVMGLKVDEASWKRGDAVLQSLAAKLGAVGVQFDESAVGLEAVATASEEATVAVAEVGEAATGAGDEFVDAADGMTGSADEVSKGVQSAVTKMWLLQQAVTLAAKAIRAAVGALQSFVVESVESSVELDRMSKALGVSTDELQRLGYVASHAGVDTGALAGSLAALSAKSLQTSKGNEQLIYTLSRVGVSLYDASGKMKAPTALLGDIADGLNRVRNPMLKATLAQELLGSSSAKLAPLLARGSSGVAALASEFDALGASTDAAGIAAGVKLGASLTRLQAIAGGLRSTIAGSLLEPMTQLADAATAWWRVNQRLIGQRITAVFAALAPPLRMAVSLLSSLASALGWVIDNGRLVAIVLGSLLFGALMANNGALLVQLALWAATQAAAIASAVAAAAAWLAVAWPFILLGVLIGVLADEVYGFVTGSESILGDFVYLCVELWNLIRDAGIAAWSALSEWLDGFITRASDAFVRLKDKVVEVFKGIVDAVLAPFRAVLDAIERVKTNGVLSSAKDFVTGGANALFGTGASGPDGSVSSNTSNRSTVIGAPRVEVTVTGAPGQSAEELGGEVASSMGSELSRVLADAAAAGGY